MSSARAIMVPGPPLIWIFLEIPKLTTSTKLDDREDRCFIRLAVAIEEVSAYDIVLIMPRCSVRV